ncbi:hypothetical protein CHARACLAT_028746 [Characodon lateralis]|uniref:Uncharacterized protein n=1 Tax=Characodon lateralis TaxID=208331 RepID=A0ABU7ENB9_9TELE|nr:hypothetical protein [Characodon lateralis]
MPHTEHSTTLTCKKCLSFFEKYVKLNPAQVEKLTEDTQTLGRRELSYSSKWATWILPPGPAYNDVPQAGELQAGHLGTN